MELGSLEDIALAALRDTAPKWIKRQPVLDYLTP